ncbi:MAG TPA: response regulator [Trueperaceae bacterium]
MVPDILIIDDSRDDCELMTWALNKALPEVVVDVCREPQEALAKLFDESVPLPRAVILDVHLSDHVNGHDVLREIRAHRRTYHLPVIVLTGYPDVGLSELSYQLRANSHVLKPVEAGDLSELMGRIGHYWTTLNALPTGPFPESAPSS